MWQGNLIRAPGFCPSQPKSCPRLFRLMLLQHISSGQADVSWPPPCSALFDLSDQIIHFQLAQGWDTVAQLFHIHVSGSTGLLRDSLCCLFLFSLLRSFFIHQNKTKQNPPPKKKKQQHTHIFISCTSYPVMFLTAHPGTGGRLWCKFGSSKAYLVFRWIPYPL